MSQHNTSNNRLGHSKGKAYLRQFDIVYKGFFIKPQTMKELSINTNIDRANICRYCAELRKTEKIRVCKRIKCPITGYWANQYTTDPEQFSFDGQMSLF